MNAQVSQVFSFPNPISFPQANGQLAKLAFNRYFRRKPAKRGVSFQVTETRCGNGQSYWRSIDILLIKE
ncbi:MULTISPECIES: hypothetical protein [Proteiniphilum]|uniref:hypothetical protein n=1 Tax=Proteiniphilum TaxID=294702 RepID=UPI001113E4DC|nr:MULTISPECIES: hypothetical protein [Proteiniphilum]MDY9919213.1 hypothetical protein [Proteiniphilum sp.]